jgi:hypothetical protein
MRNAADGTEASESMKVTNQKLASVGVPGSAARVAETESTVKVARRHPQSRDKLAPRVALQPAGTLLSPTVVLAWLLGSLGVAASVAPRLGRGWLWLDLIVAIIALLVCYDAVTLWHARNHFVPVRPGAYFVCSSDSRAVVASVDTTLKAKGAA